MRCFYFLLLFIVIPSVCLSQDYIYKKDRTIQEGKVLEITLDLIKYKKIELPKGPVFELSKKDVYKILFANGYTEIFDTINLSKNKFVQNGKKNIDSVDFVMLYVLFNDGQDISQKFPIYFNGKYICTLRNHQRLSYKLYSEGLLRVKRISKKKIGPSTEFLVLHGNFFGINILEPYPQGLDPNKRFSLEVIADSSEFRNFLQNRFYELKPYEKDEFFMKEDLKDPIIQ